MKTYGLVLKVSDQKFCLETSMGHFAGVFHPKTSFIFSGSLWD